MCRLKYQKFGWQFLKEYVLGPEAQPVETHGSKGYEKMKMNLIGDQTAVLETLNDLMGLIGMDVSVDLNVRERNDQGVMSVLFFNLICIRVIGSVTHVFRDTEDLLRDKSLGCFLIRLSEKAIGYILSYRGHDRCRHFVITQDQGGQFVVSGDCQTHGSLKELIEHYRVHPIQPFGEHLTSKGLRGNTNLDLLNTADSSYPGDLCPPGITYSELSHVESRSRSLPRLNMEEVEYSNQLISSSSSSPAPLKKTTCHTYSLHEPRERPSCSQSERPGDHEEMSRNNPLYHHSEGPGGSPSQPENMYELIPGEAAANVQGNMYESLEDMKTKKSKSTLGKNVRHTGRLDSVMERKK
uniref:SH2 domain-containing protein n=1 Tax=Labrus bergylta TaxID=56723 RepID=A0A3Q3GYK8_9LABR